MAPIEEILASLKDRSSERFSERFDKLGRDPQTCPRVFLPIGPPAAGKSTWTKAYLAAADHRTTVVMSTDDLIDDFAARDGITYAQSFDKYRDIVEPTLKVNLRNAYARRDDIIIDRTNVRVKARHRVMAEAPKFYVRVGIIFDVHPDELFVRLVKRQRETGKSVPHEVVREMIKTYQPPSLDEFDVLESFNDAV